MRNAYLYDIDDLQHVVEQNRGEREKEAHRAERIVEEELGSVNDWLRSLEVVPTIASLREAMEQIRRAELERLSGKLGDLSDAQRAQVDMLTASIVNKILHMPTVKMKEVAGSQAFYLYVDVVRTLFDLSGNGSAPAGAAGDAATDAAADDHEVTAADGAADQPGATIHHLRGTGTDNA